MNNEQQRRGFACGSSRRGFLWRTASIVLASACRPAWAALIPLSGNGKPMGNGQSQSAGSGPLRIMKDEYPRAFFFRFPERQHREYLCLDQRPGQPGSISYSEWEKTFERLMGFMGKVLDDDLPDISERALEWFTRFKKRHPDQLVMEHFDGAQRDPRYQFGKFFAGHWLYFKGAKVLSDIPAKSDDTDIKVEDVSLFRTGIGQHGNSNDDIGVCSLADGKPNWADCEQMGLISVDHAKSTIRARRGLFGTRPRAFSANHTYAAAHAAYGPWGRGRLCWEYNYSTDCPRDSKGRSCVDVLVEYLVGLFQPGGALEVFDGIEFDTPLMANRNSHLIDRGWDSNGDGEVDNGWIDGVNKFEIGVAEFYHHLRQQWPPHKLLLADITGLGLGEMNGVEEEGFHSSHWSTGLNGFYFWKENAEKPALNYVNDKYVIRKIPNPANYCPPVPFSSHRLAFAAAVFADAAIGYYNAPLPQRHERIGIWDELKKGTANQLAWLGKPVGPAVRLAEKQPDLLEGAGKPAFRLLNHLQGEGVDFVADGSALKVASRDPKALKIRFRLNSVSTEGPDLYVSLKSRAEPRHQYPTQMGRAVSVSLGGQSNLQSSTFVCQKDLSSGFYFASVSSKTVDIEFTIEGSEPIWISSLSVHAHPDTIYRAFENGAVFANPSLHPEVFRLDQLQPGRTFRRLMASSHQDVATNDGSPVGAELRLDAQDALFLVASTA